MGDTPKRMCKWDKDSIRKNFPGFSETVGKPKYACLRCGRVAASKKHVCKPGSLRAKE